MPGGAWNRSPDSSLSSRSRLPRSRSDPSKAAYSSKPRESAGLLVCRYARIMPIRDDLIAVLTPRLLPLPAEAVKGLLPSGYSDSAIGDGLKDLITAGQAWRYTLPLVERTVAEKATSTNNTKTTIDAISQDATPGTYPLDVEVSQVPQTTWDKPTDNTHLTILQINDAAMNGTDIPLSVDVIPPMTDGLYWMDRSSGHSATIQTNPPQSVALNFHVRLIYTVTVPTILHRITLGILAEAFNADHGDTTYAGISQMAATLPLAAFISNTLLVPTVPETDDGTGNPPPGLTIDGQATMYGYDLFTLTPGTWAIDVYIPTFNIPPATQCRLGLDLRDPQGGSIGSPAWTIDIGATSPPVPNYQGPQPLQPTYNLSFGNGPTFSLPSWTANQDVNLSGGAAGQGSPQVRLGATPPSADATDLVDVTVTYLKRYRYRYNGQYETNQPHPWSATTTTISGINGGSLTFTPQSTDPDLTLGGQYRDDVVVSRKLVKPPAHPIDQRIMSTASGLAYKLIPTTRPAA